MVRIGMVGTGLIAWAHGLGLRAMIDAGAIDASLEVVHDLRQKRAEGFAAACGGTTVDSVAAVIEGCDAVWVCTPTSAHGQAVEAAATAGRAVFCEKPLATDLAGALALTDVVTDAGVPAQAGLVLRSAPVFRALRALVRSGELGRPMAAVFRDDQYFPIQGRYGSKWRGDAAQAGGGGPIENTTPTPDTPPF